MRLKKGKLRPKISGLCTEVLLAVILITSLESALGYEFTITSATDGKHSKGSRHYIGGAVDFRSKDIVSLKIKKDIVNKVRARLTKDYFFALESLGKLNEHFHLEWDPVRD